MADPTELPTEIPGTMTLDQTRAAVAAFGWKLVMLPADPPKPKPGFATTTDGE